MVVWQNCYLNLISTIATIVFVMIVFDKSINLGIWNL